MKNKQPFKTGNNHPDATTNSGVIEQSRRGTYDTSAYKDFINEKLGLFVKYEREKQGLMQQDIWRECNMTASSYSLFEAGNHAPRVFSLFQIFTLLGINEINIEEIEGFLEQEGYLC